ncbi:hypothetical protein ENUP19_0265G0009 [Entamoeba nuttalli]|uniref:F-box/WD domain containing protein n=2 Tax=Entamoeba nuttalli TaxID=412467 RepID=K2GSY7_ENTNP|nr:F-box/WD domain containing protein [Entamoeba nuttalli P19]EKE36972.1 F-box/WD domain containing protein [Entamoeba nuttalli P19]|eukprot:XP_008860712.1 F-box/WD domain containing protein [Entamoeba nuttalli P19]
MEKFSYIKQFKEFSERNESPDRANCQPHFQPNHITRPEISVVRKRDTGPFRGDETISSPNTLVSQIKIIPNPRLQPITEMAHPQPLLTKNVHLPMDMSSFNTENQKEHNTTIKYHNDDSETQTDENIFQNDSSFRTSSEFIENKFNQKNYLKFHGEGKIYICEGVVNKQTILPTKLEAVIPLIFHEASVTKSVGNTLLIHSPFWKEIIKCTITLTPIIAVIQMSSDIICNSCIVVVPNSIRYNIVFQTQNGEIPSVNSFIESIISSHEHISNSISYSSLPTLTLSTIEPQLFKKIIQFLPNKDKKSLSLTSKRLHMILSSLVTSPYSAFLPTTSSIQMEKEEQYAPLPQPQRIDGHTNYVRSLDISSDFRYFVSGASDRKVRLWTLPNPSTKTSQVFSGPNSSVVSSSFIDETLAVAYKCGTVKYIPIAEPDRLLTFDIVGGKIEGFLPLTGTAFVSWGDKVQLINYHHLHQAILFTYSEHLRKVCSVKPLGPKFISTSSDRSIHIWDPNLPIPTIEKIRNVRTFNALEILDDHTFATGGESIVHIWDERKVTDPVEVLNIDSKVSCLNYSNDKLYIGTDKTVTIRSGTHWANEQNLVVDDKNGVSTIKAVGNITIAGFRDGGIDMWNFSM